MLEVFSIIEDDEFEIGKDDVNILTPGDGQNSDEVSGEEDCVDASINNLVSSLLNNPAEACIARHGGLSMLLGRIKKRTHDIAPVELFFVSLFMEEYSVFSRFYQISIDRQWL